MKTLALALSLAAAAGTPLLAAGDGSSCSSKRTAVAAWSVGENQEKDLVRTAVDAGSFQTLARALKAAGLAETLATGGPFTVFAPTDAAFAALPEGTLAELLKPENRETLRAILLYHVVEGEVPAREVVALTSAATLNGQRLDVRVEEGKVTVDGAGVQKTDVMASNGVIHVIDAVLLPSTKTVVETAVEAGRFGTLAKALRAAQLVQTLSGEGPFTVLAPTDEAFAKLPAGTLESLLRPENRDGLVAILKLHVIPGRVYASDAVAAGSATTLNGQRVRARIQDGRLMVGSASVVASDIEASNGVVHAIDQVLLPR